MNMCRCYSHICEGKFSRTTKKGSVQDNKGSVAAEHKAEMFTMEFVVTFRKSVYYLKFVAPKCFNECQSSTLLIGLTATLHTTTSFTHHLESLEGGVHA